MVVIWIAGGLGNQMFEYATARAVAERLGTEILMDTRQLDQDPKRLYALDCFGIEKKPASAVELYRFEWPSRWPWYWVPERIRREIMQVLQSEVIKENPEEFEPRVFEVEGDVYLKGYWQDIRYFESIRKKLRKIYRFGKLSRDSAVVETKIMQTKESVSVHVRRGDYASEPKTKAYHGLLGMEYYKQAVEVIKRRVKRPKLFVFSDDIGWVKKNFRLPYSFTIVESKQSEPWVEMKLMSLCRHNIIANSSYSWWGAWLNQNVNKMVVAPSRWFRQAKRPNQKLIPPEWIRV